MHLEPVQGVPRLHETPLAIVRIERPRVIVEADDEHERRIRLVFEPYQAAQVTTADCWGGVGESPVQAGIVTEIVDSAWIRQLRRVLTRIDQSANFLDKAKHFLIPAQDDFIEVVAWEVAWEPVLGGVGRIC